MKPVQAPYIFQIPYNEHFAAFHSVLPLWEEFQVVVLRHNHRQKDEHEWAELLNRVRIGKPTLEDIEKLKTRVVKDYALDFSTTHCFRWNKDVYDYNSKMLNKLPGELHEISAIQNVPKKLHKSKTTKAGRIDQTQFMKVLQVKVGARVTLVQNIWTTDGLVNGAVGNIVGVEKKDGNVYCIVVALDDKQAGEKQRLKHPKEAKKYADQNGTPIFKCQVEYQTRTKRGKSNATKAKVVQFPMRLAWGSTAHRIQVSFIIKSKF